MSHKDKEKCKEKEAISLHNAGFKKLLNETLCHNGVFYICVCVL